VRTGVPRSLLYSCASNTAITWERNASRGRPDFSSHLFSSTRKTQSPVGCDTGAYHSGVSDGISILESGTSIDIFCPGCKFTLVVNMDQSS
jgi:hypothetical protein